VAEIERNLRNNESVFRFLTVKVADHFNKEEYLKNYQPLSAEKALERGFREDREGRGGFRDRDDYRGDRGDRDGFRPRRGGFRDRE
jgi:hypothetical protein